eukprot:6851997-Prorocentrum_lima.AAC.1
MPADPALRHCKKGKLHFQPAHTLQADQAQAAPDARTSSASAAVPAPPTATGPTQQTVLVCVTGHGRRQMLQVPSL